MGPMTLDGIRRVLLRDLASLAAQLAAYPDDASLWREAPGISNPGGTLALHLAGNLRHFVGAQLGGTAYVRDREAEFARRTRSRADLVAEVAAARADVEDTLRRLAPDDLARAFPIPIGGATLATEQVLVHLAGHLAYHLGQLDYHRRLVTGGGSVPGMQSPSALADGG